MSLSVYHLNKHDLFHSLLSLLKMNTTEMQVDFTQIWQEHHDKLLAFIRKQVKQKEVAEDLLQDVFLKIRDKIGQLKDQEKLQSWMFQLTRNVIIDYFRKQSRQTDPEWEDEDETGRESNRMEEAENWIGSYILNLPENYREAVVLYELEGKSIADIANQLQISYTNARARVQRGRQTLKKNLLDCCTFHVDAYGNIIDYKRRPKEESCNCDDKSKSSSTNRENN